eukprot:5644908-Amphidinium_carterae.1
MGQSLKEKKTCRVSFSEEEPKGQPEEGERPAMGRNASPKPMKEHAKHGSRNSESFDPKTTLVRPDMRVRVMQKGREACGRCAAKGAPEQGQNYSFCLSFGRLQYYKTLECSRVHMGGGAQTFSHRSLSHDDVVVIPQFFCAEDDLSMYQTLLREMEDAQSQENPRAAWVEWHQGCHSITKDASNSQTYQLI